MDSSRASNTTMPPNNETSVTGGAGIPMCNHDGSAMIDHHGRVVYQSQYLSTHPLRADVKERLGWNNTKITYMTGDAVIRNLNTAFGHKGWTTEIIKETQIQCEQNKSNNLWTVGYLVTVRIALLQHGNSHQDVGAGEGINENKIQAHESAIKIAVTDAMKRAARHFGERLGNALYVKGNGMHKAPHTNKIALQDLERKEAQGMFGSPQLQHQQQQNRILKEKANTSNAAANNNTKDRTEQQQQQQKDKGTASSTTQSTKENETPTSPWTVQTRPVSRDAATLESPLHVDRRPDGRPSMVTPSSSSRPVLQQLGQASHNDNANHNHLAHHSPNRNDAPSSECVSVSLNHRQDASVNRTGSSLPGQDVASHRPTATPHNWVQTRAHALQSSPPDHEHERNMIMANLPSTPSTNNMLVLQQTPNELNKRQKISPPRNPYQR